jgi:hypothetical protein
MRLLPERRRHWRVVTLKNAAWLLGGLIVLFIAVSAWNEIRPGAPSGERLYERGSGDTPPAARPRPAAVVEEPPVVDQTFSVRRASDHLAPPPASAPVPSPVSIATPERARRTTLKKARQAGQRIVITGGAEGLDFKTTPAPPTATGTAVPPDRF